MPRTALGLADHVPVISRSVVLVPLGELSHGPRVESLRPESGVGVIAVGGLGTGRAGERTGRGLAAVRLDQAVHGVEGVKAHRVHRLICEEQRRQCVVSSAGNVAGPVGGVGSSRTAPASSKSCVARPFSPAGRVVVSRARWRSSGRTRRWSWRDCHSRSASAGPWR